MGLETQLSQAERSRPCALRSVPLADSDFYFLRESELFETLDTQQLNELAQVAHVVLAPPGTPIERRGETNGDVYVIAEGIVRVAVPWPGGEQSVMLSAPNAVGWSNLIHPYRQLASASTATMTRLIVLPAEQLRALMNLNPRLRVAITNQIAFLAVRRLGDVFSALEGLEPLHEDAAG